MTTANERLLMTEQEFSEYQHHVQNLNFDAVDGHARFRVQHTRDGIPYLPALPFDHPPVWSRNSIEALNGMIYK